MELLEKILDFIVRYWVYLTLVGGSLILLIVVSAILNAKNQVRDEETSPEPRKTPEPTPEPRLEVVEAEVMNPNPVFARDDETKETPGPLTPVETPKTPGTGTLPPETSKIPGPGTLLETPTNADPGIPKEPQPEKPAPLPKKILGKYHVMYRNDGKWYVKREGSTTVLRVLETQREAVSWAIIKALPQDIGIVVHDKDGKIKKAEPL